MVELEDAQIECAIIIATCKIPVGQRSELDARYGTCLPGIGQDECAS